VARTPTEGCQVIAAPLSETYRSGDNHQVRDKIIHLLSRAECGCSLVGRRQCLGTGPSMKLGVRTSRNKHSISTCSCFEGHLPLRKDVTGVDGLMALGRGEHCFSIVCGHICLVHGLRLTTSLGLYPSLKPRWNIVFTTSIHARSNINLRP
jgi:hypothetical protein